MTRPLVIAHGNGHNRHELVSFIRDADADSAGGNEAQDLIGDLKEIPHARLIVGGPNWDSERGRHRSTLIVASDRNTSMGDLSIRVAERVPEVIKWAPERALVASLFEHPVADQLGLRGVAHFEHHAHATVKNRPEDSRVVLEYRQGLDYCRHWMRAAKSNGYLVVLTGDLQLTDDWDKPWGPRADLADPLDLDTATVHIDWLMWDRRLKKAGKLKTVDLFDHRAFVANLVPA